MASLGMWQTGSENMMQSESHKEGVSMYVTRQLGQEELTANTCLVSSSTGCPRSIKGKGSGNMYAVDFVELRKCPAIGLEIGL